MNEVLHASGFLLVSVWTVLFIEKDYRMKGAQMSVTRLLSLKLSFHEHLKDFWGFKGPLCHIYDALLLCARKSLMSQTFPRAAHPSQVYCAPDWASEECSWRHSQQERVRQQEGSHLLQSHHGSDIQCWYILLIKKQVSQEEGITQAVNIRRQVSLGPPLKLSTPKKALLLGNQRRVKNKKPLNIQGMNLEKG